MNDPRNPDPRPHDPAEMDPAASPYRDPAAEPRLSTRTVVQPSSGRGGLIAAGVIAVLLVVALIAFTSGTTTDPGTTAVIPDEAGEVTPAPEAVPAAPAPEAPAEVEEAPAAPGEQAPAPAE